MTGDDEDWMEDHQVRGVTASDSFFFSFYFFLETTDTSEHIAYDVDEAYFASVTATSTR